VTLSPADARLLERYVALITQWNRRLRLTGPKGAEDVARILGAGAFNSLPFVPAAGSLVDLGSGAGIPGIPLAVMRPSLRVALVEASRKKAAFLELAVRDLGLAHTVVLHARAEDLGHDPDHRERYDVATAQALAPLRVLAEYALPLLRTGGVAVFPKGAGAADEAAGAADVFRILGGYVETQAASSNNVSSVIVVRKTRPTPLEFPRRPGVPSRRPL
jgi:16S rRNA (guanine527-N7)-methyltransferase